MVESRWPQRLSLAASTRLSTLGQVLAGPIDRIGLAHRQTNCAFFVAWTDHFQVPNGRHFPPLHALFLEQSAGSA
jgi:hypothetical protein